ncbi:MAG: hypothetical protein ACREQ5_02660 [Candidatus Dormibacteria bacterium]
MILVGHEVESRRNRACFYCSTSETAFGPVFRAEDGLEAEKVAEAFMVWLETHPTERWNTQRGRWEPSFDPRSYREKILDDLHATFIEELRGELPPTGKLPEGFGQQSQGGDIYQGV